MGYAAYRRLPWFGARFKNIRFGLWPCLVACTLAASLGGGAALKGECFGSHQQNWRSRLCYNDILPLYHDPGHGIRSGKFPYLHAKLVGTKGEDGFNEYPVLTGVFMWTMGRVSRGGSSYLALTNVALSICAAISTLLLWRLVGRRSIWFAAPPMLLLYAFHNWDVLAVTASVVGLYEWRRGRSTTATLAFAVGGAFKLYPALFIVPLILDAYKGRGRGRAIETGAVGFGSLALINLPFILANAGGWWATYRFHEERVATSSGTAWSVLDSSLSTPTENRLSAACIVVGLLAVTMALQRVSRESVGYPVIQWCGAATAMFISLNKVSSPQYILWVLPFLALIVASPAWWGALAVVVTVRYVGLFGVDVFPVGFHTADNLVHVAVVAQTALLLAYAARVSTSRLITAQTFVDRPGS
jgi:uncharacterized membrane protein